MTLAITNDLRSLAERATAEYRQANAAAADALQHAFACGELLLQAQAQVPEGRWGAWCRENVPEINFTTVTNYCRLTRYREQLVAGEFTTIERAMSYLRALNVPRAKTGPRRGRPKKLDVDEAKKLHAQGMTFKDIAEVYDVSDVTVAVNLDPQRRASHMATQLRIKRERKAARAAAEQERRDTLVRNHGGGPAEAYAMLRRTAVVIDRAVAEVQDDPRLRSKLTAALGYCHKAEDEIVSALQITRTA